MRTIVTLDTFRARAGYRPWSRRRSAGDNHRHGRMVPAVTVIAVSLDHPCGDHGMLPIMHFGGIAGYLTGCYSRAGVPLIHVLSGERPERKRP